MSYGTKGRLERCDIAANKLSGLQLSSGADPCVVACTCGGGGEGGVKGVRRVGHAPIPLLSPLFGGLERRGAGRPRLWWRDKYTGRPPPHHPLYASGAGRCPSALPSRYTYYVLLKSIAFLLCISNFRFFPSSVAL